MTLEVAISHRIGAFRLEAEFRVAGGVTALFGHSGAGKSTVVNAISGLLRPDSGRIVAGGEVLYDAARGIDVPPHRRRIGYVFQDTRLFPHMTVAQNLSYGARFGRSRGAGRDRDLILDLLGIAPLLQRQPRTLSGGEKSRVALARAILAGPRLLLMDEPLAALDAARKAEILPYLERLRDDLHLPIIYVSHSVAEVTRLATSIVLLDGGRVVASGPAEAILADPAIAPAFGQREIGTILPATVAAQEEDGLTRLATPGGPVWVPGVPDRPGAAVRLRIMAQDVMIAQTRPEGISALNVLAAEVSDIRLGDGPGALVQLNVGGSPILSRITRRSAVALGLAPGKQVHAVLKAVSVARDSVGHSVPPETAQGGKGTNTPGFPP